MDKLSTPSEYARSPMVDPCQVLSFVPCTETPEAKWRIPSLRGSAELKKAQGLTPRDPQEETCGATLQTDPPDDPPNSEDIIPDTLTGFHGAPQPLQLPGPPPYTDGVFFKVTSPPTPPFFNFCNQISVSVALFRTKRCGAVPVEGHDR